MKLWDVSRPFKATCSVVVMAGERLLPSALTSVTDINGRTSSGRIYLEWTTEQDAPETNRMSMHCPLILPVVYAALLGMVGVEMAGVCSMGAL